MPKLRIFLAEDHGIVRDGLKGLIDAQPDMEVAGVAEDGEAACLGVEECEPDVVVMDISMPRLSGAEATRRLIRERPGLKILVLTAFEDKSYLRQLLTAGASGYLLKRAAANELVQAIRAVAAGHTYIDPALVGKIVDTFVQRPADEARPEDELSEREQEVLLLIAWGHSYKEIAARLGIGVSTVDTYKTRLMEKLKLRSRADIVRYAAREGLLKEG